VHLVTTTTAIDGDAETVSRQAEILVGKKKKEKRKRMDDERGLCHFGWSRIYGS
jgi:hypothetical protein